MYVGRAVVGLTWYARYMDHLMPCSHLVRASRLAVLRVLAAGVVSDLIAC